MTPPEDVEVRTAAAADHPTGAAMSWGRLAAAWAAAFAVRTSTGPSVVPPGSPPRLANSWRPTVRAGS
ncbi:hypothetical protein SAMN05661080_00439 [Modestobacter sp. DSM 44400]|uniref:hypothetical protein n=1 Tax=Modestobacter sp. DSM 44400 TaxID=1550230 RepID=UPI000898183F|nr:hypothetical protein [Modestobacter sp. DSM 44400]SDX55228.1 hypothetical protein SAMN05661080_00439 [Modestobacter sp. DSM 44400]